MTIYDSTEKRSDGYCMLCAREARAHNIQYPLHPFFRAIIYTICPDTLKDGDWEELKEDYADKLIVYAEERIPGLSDHIQVLEILTPKDWRARTGLDHHAFGGIKPVLGAWRVPFKSPIDGLWFVGAQSESGGGVGAVMPAAFKTARQIDENSPACPLAAPPTIPS